MDERVMMSNVVHVTTWANTTRPQGLLKHLYQPSVTIRIAFSCFYVGAVCLGSILAGNILFNTTVIQIRLFANPTATIDRQAATSTRRQRRH